MREVTLPQVDDVTRARIRKRIDAALAELRACAHVEILVDFELGLLVRVTPLAPPQFDSAAWCALREPTECVIDPGRFLENAVENARAGR